MRIIVQIVPKALCEPLYLLPHTANFNQFSFSDEDALIFPCESFAQAWIDGFLASRDPADYCCSIQDKDDPERGPLEPLWTGPCVFRHVGAYGFARISPVDNRTFADTYIGSPASIFPDAYRETWQ